MIKCWTRLCSSPPLRTQRTLRRLSEFGHQVRLPITYQSVTLDAGYRVDFLIENCVVVELKSVEKLLPLHLAQVMTYLKLSGHHVGLLINFNVPHLRHGIRRVVNNYQEDRQN